MKAFNKVAALAIVALLGLGVQSCAKKPASSAADAGSAGAGNAGASGTGAGGTGGFDANNINSYTPENIIENIKLVNIYFEFNASSLKEEDRRFLKVLSQGLALEKNKAIALKIEGNTDERGSNEYNLALGERRARSVYEYLTNLGVAKKRLDVVSYGEERPAELGSSETAWSKNRRAAFDVK